VKQALDRGAMGFIPKSSSNEVMQSALRLVLAGGVYLPPEILGRSDAAAIAPWPAQSAAHAQVNVAPMTAAQIGLTERQAQILALMMKGESNKVICRELHVAESTVKNQITAILKALNVTSRTQAVLEVTKLGLVLPAMRRKDQ
jgi:DNA-binding NarL/FixJ family response regulator